MKLKAIYISGHNLNNQCDGISNKILNQIKVFKRIFYECDFIFLSDKSCVYDESGVKKVKNNVNKYLFFFNAFFLAFKKKYDLIYFRIPFNFVQCLSVYFLLLFKNKSKVKIILEIPHYPFVDEASSSFNKLNLILIDKIIKNILSHKLYAITYFGSLNPINFKCKLIKLSNGASRTSVKKEVKLKSYFNDFHFIGVAQLNYWHGYDRMIHSLKKYYDESKLSAKIYFHIIGDNEPCLSDLKNIVDFYNLSQYVIFHGRREQKYIQEFYLKCHVGVDSLGRHRTNSEYNDSIKSKEYIMNYLPVLKSHKDDTIDGNSFVINVKADESIFDIKEILNSFKANHEEWLDEIADKQHLYTWEHIFKTAFSKIEG